MQSLYSNINILLSIYTVVNTEPIALKWNTVITQYISKCKHNGIFTTNFYFL